MYRDNRAFHDLLLSLAGSASLSSVVAWLVHSTILMRTYRAFDEGAMHRSVEHHLELVAAVQARDPDWAESVMRSHLFSARAALLGPRAASSLVEHRRGHPVPPNRPPLRAATELDPVLPTGPPCVDGDPTAQESA